MGVVATPVPALARNFPLPANDSALNDSIKLFARFVSSLFFLLLNMVGNFSEGLYLFQGREHKGDDDERLSRTKGWGGGKQREWGSMHAGL
jgi:hypothetical protein